MKFLVGILIYWLIFAIVLIAGDFNQGFDAYVPALGMTGLIVGILYSGLNAFSQTRKMDEKVIKSHSDEQRNHERIRNSRETSSLKEPEEEKPISQ